MSIERRAKKETAEGGVPVKLSRMLLGLPTLASFLQDHTYSDDSKRVTGTMLLFVEQGAWKCCLRDRDMGEVAFCTGDTLESLLANVEAALAKGTLDWRADQRTTKDFKKKS